jgi:cytochrome c553
MATPHVVERFVSMVGSRLIGVLAVFCLGAVAHAQEDVTELVTICASCHGEDGRPIEADYPIIFGQEFYYLYVQLKDYQAGRRANDIMQPIVADLTKEQMQALAQYFAEQPWPTLGFRASQADIADGRSAASAGQCTQCHLGDFTGDSRVPRLAGQSPGYLERTMLEFKNRVRRNAPDMSALFAAYDEPDIVALAHYLGGMAPP